MNSRYDRISMVPSTLRIVIVFLALAMLVLALVSTIPASRPVKARTEVSRSGSRIVVRRSQDTKQSCCGGDEGANKPHTLAGSYYTLKNNSSAKLLLNNKGPAPIEIHPTIFAMSGEKFEPRNAGFQLTRTARGNYYDSALHSSGRNSMVECQLPKLKVASSSLVARSRILARTHLQARL